MKTKNYSMFRFIDTNRVLNQGIINRLIESINKIGYIESRPVIVNQDMIIIDGQHRFEACKKMNIDICYEIENIDVETAMIELNANQLIWRQQDYIASYAAKGVDCYVKLMEFENKYKLGISNSIITLLGTSANAKEIRKGKVYELNQFADKIAQFCLSAKKYLYFGKDKHFVWAVCVLYKRASEKDIEKLFSQISIVQRFASVSDYLKCFENIINKNKKGDINKIKLL